VSQQRTVPAVGFDGARAPPRRQTANLARPRPATAPFKAALDELATLGEPINRVLEVDLDGNDVIFALYDLPRTAPRA
jgi:hypothetical protein